LSSQIIGAYSIIFHEKLWILKDWEETVALLYNGLVHNYADLYTLTVDHTRAHGTKISRELGKRSRKLKEYPIWTCFICVRDRYYVGETVAKKLALQNIEALASASFRASSCWWNWGNCSKCCRFFANAENVATRLKQYGVAFEIIEK
jgi:NAD-dependent DNA ligase